MRVPENTIYIARHCAQVDNSANYKVRDSVHEPLYIIDNITYFMHNAGINVRAATLLIVQMSLKQDAYGLLMIIEFFLCGIS